VKFDATVHPDLPWSLVPLERKVRVRPGEAHLVKFVAQNRSGREITGQAIPSIAPWQATGFFSKMECFCFTQQTLAGNERVEMPLRFSVSPDLPTDIDSLTLSYNVLRISEPGALASTR
jgi:cytochrome c oxidase assembly protein subunit 11